MAVHPDAPGVITLRDVHATFPAGTEVTVHARNGAQALAGQRPAAPPGPVIATAIVAEDATVTFADLPARAQLCAHAQVDGQHRTVSFSTFPWTKP